MIFTTLSISMLNHPLNGSLLENPLNERENLYDDMDKLPQNSNYNPSVQGSGLQLNASLHQAIYNDTQISIDNSSDPLNVSFTVACPTDTNFNSSFVNITIEDIFAPNHTVNVEEDACLHVSNLDENNPMATSFQVLGSGYLTNVTCFVRNPAANPSWIKVYLYNSTWDSGQSCYVPNMSITANQIGWLNPATGVGAAAWYSSNITIYEFLNSSLTTDNVWFIGLLDSGSTVPFAGQWMSVPDAHGDGDSDDEADCVEWNGSNWILEIDQSGTADEVDFPMKLDVIPINNTPNPEDIGLMLNGTAFTGYPTVNGSGYWSSTNAYSNPSGDLNFTLSAEWWDVECNITSKQINYTKVDLTADSAFTIPYGGFDVTWNVSRSGGFNQFDSRFNNYTIDFTIPSNWDSDIKAYNDTTQKTVDTTGPIINGFKNITILDGGNGINWYLLANSTNLIQSIDMSIGGTPVDTVSISYDVHFNATFTENIMGGELNLSVFNPANASNVMNYTYIDLAPPFASEISLTDWDISNNATGYGDFRVQVFWNNDTHAAFNETILTINKDTATEIIGPSTTFNVIRGIDANYTFSFNESGGPGVDAATIINTTTLNPGLSSDINEISPGNYSIVINTSNADVSQSPFEANYTISKVGYAPQDINLIINVEATNTSIKINDYNATLLRKNKLNQSISFYFNDTINNDPILGLTTDKVEVRDGTDTLWQRGTGDHNWTIISAGGGDYILNVSTTGLNMGTHTVKINITFDPNYNSSQAQISFYLQGNSSQVNLLNFTFDNGGEILPTGANNSYECYIGSDINIEFNLTDSDEGNKVIMNLANSYPLEWYNRSNYLQNGTLEDDFAWNLLAIDYGTHQGNLNTSKLAVGNYTINLTVVKLNYENVTFTFNLTIIEQINVNITAVDQPTSITAGGTLSLTFLVEYKYNSTTWKPLAGVAITATLYVDSEISGASMTTIVIRTAVAEDTGTTDANGEATLTLTIPSSANKIKIVIAITGDFNITSTPLEITNISVNPPASGIGIEDFLIWLILIGIVVGAAVGVYGVYKGVIVPKKQKKERILTEVKTIFDDAINLEHTLVLYKGTGTCIFFKSFGTEEIDPELISGFLTAVGSFGKEMESQQALNEITYGDKTLLLADGEHIRVALVLGKEASVILRQHLQEFIEAFEQRYTKELPNWRGQLDLFQHAGDLIDDKLNTSIILPHEITYEHSNVKSLKNPDARGVLKIANELVEDTDRKFFFIATLLKEAVERTGNDNAEIFMGIKELRDKKILMPIEISSIEGAPVSEQEINLIFQRVGELPNLSDEEKQALATNLASMGPAEREAYMTSLTEQREIVSAPVEKGGPAVVDSAKSAKKEIGRLQKEAKIAKKETDYKSAVGILKNAASIANSWDLTKLYEDLQDTVRLTIIEDLRIKMKSLEQAGKLAAKDGNYAEAAQKYKVATEMANEIFKLGVTEMTKELKLLSNKAKEYEKLS